MRVFFFFFENDHEIHNVSEFVSVLQRREEGRAMEVCYRGLARYQHKVDPSLFRNDGHIQHEAEMMRTLFASQPDAFSGDTSTLEKLVRFQHFGLPTRLMDVTWNPLVALYFCVKDHLDRGGRVVTIACKPTIVKFFDSDTVSALANLSYLNSTERNALRLNALMTRGDFNRLPEVKRLVNFVKPEKPYFENIVEPKDLAVPVLVRPKHNNRRIAAQNGAFIIFGLGDSSTLDGYQEFEIRSLIVKAAAKRPILKELDKLGFNDESMFPELEMAAKYVRAKFAI